MADLNNSPPPEAWRVIADFPPYEVSDGGRVRRATPGPGARAGRMLRPHERHGYPCVCLYRGRGGKRHDCYVHRLVAAAFLCPALPGQEVNHINFDRRDNRVANLEWVTRRQNIRHSQRHGRLATGARNGTHTHPQGRPRGDRNGARTKPECAARGNRHGAHTKPERRPRGSAHGRSRLTETAVAEVKARLSRGESGAALAREFGVSHALISRIKYGKLWTHVPASDPTPGSESPPFTD